MNKRHSNAIFTRRSQPFVFFSRSLFKPFAFHVLLWFKHTQGGRAAHSIKQKNKKKKKQNWPTKRGQEPSGLCGRRSWVQMQIQEPSGSFRQPASIPQRADAQSTAPIGDMQQQTRFYLSLLKIPIRLVTLIPPPSIHCSKNEWQWLITHNRQGV